MGSSWPGSSTRRVPPRSSAAAWSRMRRPSRPACSGSTPTLLASRGAVDAERRRPDGRGGSAGPRGGLGGGDHRGRRPRAAGRYAGRLRLRGGGRARRRRSSSSAMTSPAADRRSGRGPVRRRPGPPGVPPRYGARRREANFCRQTTEIRTEVGLSTAAPRLQADGGRVGRMADGAGGWEARSGRRRRIARKDVAGSDVVLTEMPHQTTSPPLRRPARRFAFGGTNPWRLATTGYGGDHSTGRPDTAEEGFHGPVAT